MTLKRHPRHEPDANEPIKASDAPAGAELTHDAIAVRAYELYVARGCADGCDVDDWLQAERDLGSPEVARGESHE